VSDKPQYAIVSIAYLRFKGLEVSKLADPIQVLTDPIATLTDSIWKLTDSIWTPTDSIAIFQDCSAGLIFMWKLRRFLLMK